MSQPVAETPDPEVVPTNVFLLYLGIRKSTVYDNKKIFVWHKIELSQNNGDILSYDSDNEVVFDKKNVKNCQPGAIVQIRQHPNGKSYYPKSAVIVDEWKNKQDIALWVTNSVASEKVIDSEKESVKKLKESLPSELLKPFREAYINADSRKKHHILAYVIGVITKYTNS